MSAFYLSEMAVSDRHGGGATLQRVLGSDLFRFDALVSVGSFARMMEAAPQFASVTRQIDLPLDAFPERTNVLRHFKPWLRSRPFISRWELGSSWRRLKKILGDRPRLLVCPQWLLAVDLTARAVNELGAEYVTWVMDDHPLKVGGAAMSYSPDYEKQWSEHLRGAHKVFVISDAMGDFYRHNFGVEAEVLHGAVPLAAGGSTFPSRPSAGNGGLRLGYAGSLSGWQKDCMELLADALTESGGELHVAGPIQPEWLKRSGVNYLGHMAHGAAVDMLRQCDAVVLPISFTPEHTALSRLNIATKLSELCACGRPMLAIGPADAAMIRVLSRHGAAVCVTKPTREDVVEGLRQVSDQTNGNRVAANARRLFEHELNLEEMQRRWQTTSSWLFDQSAS